MFGFNGTGNCRSAKVNVYAPAVVTVSGVLSVERVASVGELWTVKFPVNDGLWAAGWDAMQFEGSDFGAAHTENVPTLGVPGTPNTAMVKSPLAAGRDTVATEAGAVSVALPAIAPAWVTTTEADFSSAGICKSVNVTTRSGAGVVAGEMWNDR